MQMFKSPKESLGDLGAQSAAKLIAAATDVAVVVDGQGIIRDVAFNKEELSPSLAQKQTRPLCRQISAFGESRHRDVTTIMSVNDPACVKTHRLL